MRKQPAVRVALGVFALVLAVAFVRFRTGTSEDEAPTKTSQATSRPRTVSSAPTPPPHGNHVLRGRVLDTQRRPAPGITLSATRAMPGESLSALLCDSAPDVPLSSGDCIGESEERVRSLVEAGHGASPVVAQAVSAPDGTFVLSGLPEGTVALWAIGERHAALALDVPTRTEDVELVLEEGLFLPGRVVDESGRPLPGARVTLFHQAHSRFFAAQADSEGRFAFGPLPPGDYTLVAASEGLLTDSLQDVDEEVIDPVVLHPPRRLSGRVLADEAPVAGAEVHVEHTSQAGVTDAQGRFSFDSLAPGDYEVRAEHQGEYGFAAVTLTEEGGDADATVRLGTHVYLEGTVRDESGRPIREASVGAAPPRGQAPPVDYAATSADGRFRLGPLRLEPYVFNVVASGYQGLLHEDTPAPGLRLDFTLPSAYLVQGAVTDAQGNPVADVEVALDDQERDEAETELQDVETVTSDANGRFELAFPRPGRHTLVFTSESHLEERILASAPGSGLRVVLRGAARVEGTVTSSRGTPIRRVAVTLVDDETKQRSWQVQSDEEGHFSIGGVPPGRYTLRAGADIGSVTRQATQTLTVHGTETVETSLQLDTGEPISGIVVDELGRPVANAMIDANSLDTKGRGVLPAIAYSDAEGRFTLNHLADGASSLRASKDGYAFEATEPLAPGVSPSAVLAKSGARDVRLVLRSQGHIHGRLVREDGSPITRFTLNEQSFRDPRGAFQFAALMAGEQRLSFEAPGLTRAVHVVQVAAGEDLDLGEVRLVAGRKVRGRVVDAETYQPLVDAIIEVHLPGEGGSMEETTPVAVAVTGTDGAFTFPPLEARPLDVLVQTNLGHPLRRQHIGTGDENLELRIPPGARVEGTLTDRDGKPVDAIVHLIPDAQGTSFPVEEETGSFLAEHVPEGTYTLSASVGRTAEGRSVTILPRRVTIPPMGKVAFALTETTGGGTLRLDVRMPPIPPGTGQYTALLAGTLPPGISGRDLRNRARFGDIRASTKSHGTEHVYEQLPGGRYTFIVLLEVEDSPPRFELHREELSLAEGATLAREIQVAPRPIP
ncbi:carboxypeptidase regulatory-like domain-containing protein [Myxococcus sp. Y35]|uniref:carboxypeptidase regulatory-like domain-containing protein n=1 Tax=Pseudomyxococcus flavus TaxID=3115648 RepID=UPI003CF60716